MAHWKIAVTSLLASAILCGGDALAWGPEGHAIVAEIAEARLTDTARAQIAELLAARRQPCPASRSNRILARCSSPCKARNRTLAFRRYSSGCFKIRRQSRLQRRKLRRGCHPTVCGRFG